MRYEGRSYMGSGMWGGVWEGGLFGDKVCVGEVCEKEINW